MSDRPIIKSVIIFGPITCAGSDNLLFIGRSRGLEIDGPILFLFVRKI
jgi:hypothetical protein